MFRLSPGATLPQRCIGEYFGKEKRRRASYLLVRSIVTKFDFFENIAWYFETIGSTLTIGQDLQKTLQLVLVIVVFLQVFGQLIEYLNTFSLKIFGMPAFTN